jgi:hypothetical protein
MHQAEDLLMETGAICPLYWYTDSFLIKESAQIRLLRFAVRIQIPLWRQAESVTACIASQPDTIDPALNSSVDGATYVSHLFEGLDALGIYRHLSERHDRLNRTVSLPDEADRLEKDQEQRWHRHLHIPLKTGLKWSDGTAMMPTISSVRGSVRFCANTGADYAYMFEIFDGGAEAEGEADGSLRLPPKPTRIRLNHPGLAMFRTSKKSWPSRP